MIAETAQPASHCYACGDPAVERHVSVREMMFGSRERFTYGICRGCGSASIVEVPADLARHYPADYYSFAAPTRVGRLREFVKSRRAAHVLGRRNLLGALALRMWGPPVGFEWSRHARIGRDDRILDVGCGRGHLLLEMRDGGFHNLTGIDPYLDADVQPAPGVRLFKRDLAATEGAFDFVMMHHSLEHMPEPREAMVHVRRLLSPGGRALVRVPVAGRHAGRTYGTDWVQWDAPRHLFIPTPEGMERLARAAGLSVEEVVYDSRGFQFWGSEMYRHDVPLSDRERQLKAGADSLFTADQLRGYEEEAAALNRAEDGDQACFFLRIA